MQSGNANYLAASNVSQAFTVTTQSQTIAFAPLGNRIAGTEPFTVSGTASSGLPVVFSSPTTSTCTVSGTTVTLVAQGTCTIRATQGGNASFAAAPPADQSFNVGASVGVQYTYDAAGNVIRIQRIGSP